MHAWLQSLCFKDKPARVEVFVSCAGIPYLVKGWSWYGFLRAIWVWYGLGVANCM
jgi:hypothetical protein